MNKTGIVIATVALAAIALGIFLILSTPPKVAVQSAPGATTSLSVRPAGHPVLDRFEDVRHQMQHKNAITAVKAAYDATVDHSASKNQ